MKWIILIILIFVFICTLNISRRESFSEKKCQLPYLPYLWNYWEFKNGSTKKAGYLELCEETVKKNGYLFNVVFLNDKNIYDYLPDLRKDINELPLALKADYIRVRLLYKYGGMWMDADVIMIDNMKEVVDLLNKGTDYIGFGCTGNQCTYGYGIPSNAVMGASKGSILMKNCLDNLNDILDNYFSKPEKQEFDYHDLGKTVIWRQYKKLKDEMNYKYYHFPSYVDGTRDKNGYWIPLDMIFKEHIDLLDENKLMYVSLVNSSFCGSDSKYNWFCKMSKEDILKSDLFVGKMFRKALE